MQSIAVSRCYAEPGSYQTPGPLRPRLCSAPLRKRYALRCVRGTTFAAVEGFAMLAWRQPINKGAREARHGQGSDAQQQGKEETEAGQEPEKGRRRALAVRVRQAVGKSLSRQEGL